MRLFVAVEMAPLAEEIGSVQERLADVEGLRLTDPTQAHLTLKFLGDTDEEQVPDVRRGIERAVESSEVGSFRLEATGLGVFPSLEYISVVWLGIGNGSEPLTRLHELLEDHALALGYPPEDHDFTPHVTLARMEHAAEKERVQDIVESADPTAGWLDVESIHLVESTLTEKGPVYETVETFDLHR